MIANISVRKTATGAIQVQVIQDDKTNLLYEFQSLADLKVFVRENTSVTTDELVAEFIKRKFQADQNLAQRVTSEPVTYGRTLS